jgi:hypothetical protein
MVRRVGHSSVFGLFPNPFTGSARPQIHLLYEWGRTGTLSAKDFFLKFVVKNPRTYLSSWYVYRWNDTPSRASANSMASMANADGI